MNSQKNMLSNVLLHDRDTYDEQCMPYALSVL
ncbi:hypothetical protein T4B_11105 [Trichinella pseudospiralis]|uniref:Uncharacterized protein n=1 Tax=Trichinella pseudospiralis TaxID=6337 RepID=A0A0V1GL85_TRIPS|nr:hypothetical protein T4B_11105 [Trichinella pseudospiralis]KRZ10613.1 hypothetical protein T4C_2643 [Trichinella pseudospiralis]